MKPFRFASETGLVRWTGYKAQDLNSFLDGLQKVSGSSIYYHFYQSLYRKHFLTVDFMHDFARWVLISLNLPPLAERLAQVDPTDYDSIRTARERMIDYVRDFLGEGGQWFRIPASAPFYFLQQDSFVIRTGHEASDLRQFLGCLELVAESSIYYHLVEARIRLGGTDNDFSVWLETELGETDLADRVRALNIHRRPIGVTRQLVADAVRGRLEGDGA